MRFDGSWADAEVIRDLARGSSFGDECQDFAFAWCQFLETIPACLTRSLIAKRGTEFVGDAVAKVFAARRNGLHCFPQLRGPRALQDVSVRTGPYGAENVLGMIVHAEDEEADAAAAGAGRANHVKPAHVGHADVENCDIRRVSVHALHGFPAGTDFGDHFETGRGLEHGANAFANDNVIVCDQHADARRRFIFPLLGFARPLVLHDQPSLP